MTPEELAKYRSEKLQKAQQDEEARKRVQEEQKAQYASEIDALRAALADRILPYLQTVGKAMDGALNATPVRSTDGELVGIDVILDGRRGDIRLAGSTLQAYTKHPMTSQHLAYTKLRTAEDVTDDNISGFIKFLMDAGEKR